MNLIKFIQLQCNDEAKLKVQNGSRLRDSKKGLVVTKGEGCGRVGGEGGRRGLRGIMFSTHGVRGSFGEQCSTEKAHSGSLATCCTDGQ